MLVRSPSVILYCAASSIQIKLARVFAVGAGVLKGGAPTGVAAGNPLGVPSLPVVLRVGGAESRVGVTFWVR